MKKILIYKKNKQNKNEQNNKKKKNQKSQQEKPFVKSPLLEKCRKKTRWLLIMGY